MRGIRLNFSLKDQLIKSRGNFWRVDTWVRRERGRPRRRHSHASRLRLRRAHAVGRVGEPRALSSLESTFGERKIYSIYLKKTRIINSCLLSWRVLQFALARFIFHRITVSIIETRHVNLYWPMKLEVDDVLVATLRIIALLNRKNRSAHIAHEIAATTGVSFLFTLRILQVHAIFLWNYMVHIKEHLRLAVKKIFFCFLAGFRAFLSSM